MQKEKYKIYSTEDGHFLGETWSTEYDAQHPKNDGIRLVKIEQDEEKRNQDLIKYRKSCEEILDKIKKNEGHIESLFQNESDIE